MITNQPLIDCSLWTRLNVVFRVSVYVHKLLTTTIKLNDVNYIQPTVQTADYKKLLQLAEYMYFCTCNIFSFISGKWYQKKVELN